MSYSSRLQIVKTASDKTELVDINNCLIDTTKPLNERRRGFTQKVRNPNLFIIGDLVVRIEYTGKRSFSDAFLSALKSS